MEGRGNAGRPCVSPSPSRPAAQKQGTVARIGMFCVEATAPASAAVRNRPRRAATTRESEKGDGKDLNLRLVDKPDDRRGKEQEGNNRVHVPRCCTQGQVHQMRVERDKANALVKPEKTNQKDKGRCQQRKEPKV